MPKPTNYWKLGLFVVLSLATAVVASAYFGRGLIRQDAVDYRTYFDESVEGLEVGAAVRFRGLTIGRVSEIGVAPDRRHMAVTSALSVKELRRQGLALREDHRTGLRLAPEMRAQLVLTGLTGVQVLGIDFFDPATHPPPVLGFPLPEHYIPSTPSTVTSLVDALGEAAGRLPGMLDGTARLLDQATAVVTDLAAVRPGERVVATLHRADEVLGSLRRTVDSLDAAHLPAQAGEALATLEAALARLAPLLEHVDGERGLVTSARRATDAVGDLARGSHGLGGDLEGTLRELREAAGSIRRLANAVDRQPDILLKGRAKPRAP